MIAHPRARLLLTLIAAALCPLACSEDGTEVATECVKSDLIAQCPPGSDPRLDAAAASKCEAAGDANLITQDGSITGSCVGEGTCSVLCQFLVPCECGVDMITDQGVFCADCAAQTACGNDECEAGESPDSCPIDCGAVCTPGNERCNGNARQICNLNGRFDTVDCPDDERCAVDPGDATKTLCTR